MSEYTPTTDQMREWFAEPKSESEAMSPDAHYEASEMFDRWLAEHTAERERAAAEKAWKRLADIVYPLYETAEDVLLAGADTQKLMGPLAKLGAQSNPYRLNEGEKQ